MTLNKIRKVQAFCRISGRSEGVFETITDASNVTGQKHRDIAASCQGKHEYSKRFLWQYLEDPREFEFIQQSSSDNKVLGMYLSVESAAKAARVRSLSIYPVLNGKRKSLGGFRFKRVKAKVDDVEVTHVK